MEINVSVHLFFDHRPPGVGQIAGEKHRSKALLDVSKGFICVIALL